MKHLPLTTGRISATLLAAGLALAACSGPKAAADQTAAAPASASQADQSAPITDSSKKADARGKHKSRRHKGAAKKTAAGK
jgi:hypothetical protein